MLLYHHEQQKKSLEYDHSLKDLLDHNNEAIESFRELTEEIRLNILPKFLDSKNLNFLIGTGASLYSGAQVINKTVDNDVPTIDIKDTELKEKILNILKNNRLEEGLDKLYQIKAYFEVLNEEESANQIDQLIDSQKRDFLEKYILNIDYAKNKHHRVFLKKILSRKSNLSKVNIFTTNYDLLFERTAEEMDIQVNNGFVGFQKRTFNPSNFYLDIFVNSLDEKGKKYSKIFNLLKLHGSLSWSYSENCPPYGITEKQIKLSADSQIDSDDSSDCIIYPIQNKKKISLDLPYSELFRKFVESLNKTESVLVSIGYSFWDEHINDLISNALCNPDFSLVVFSFSTNDEKNLSPYLKRLFSEAYNDRRITIFEGEILGNFEIISQYLLPYVDESNPIEEAFKTYKELKSFTASKK